MTYFAEVAALSLHDKLVADVKSYVEDHDAAATVKFLAGEADSAEEQGKEEDQGRLKPCVHIA